MSRRRFGPRSDRPVRKASRTIAQSQRTSQAQLQRPITLGFVRGVAPRKWAERWSAAHPRHPLELVPVEFLQVDAARASVDVLLERVGPRATPVGTDFNARTRHAIRLYEEDVALVVTNDHELAEQPQVGLDDIALIELLAHPDHYAAWPAATPWKDPEWYPQNAEGTLELVASGAGCALMPLPLARHLMSKRSHSVLPVKHGDSSLLPGSEIWASWEVARDADDIQQLVGIFRGRTARSSRNG